MNALSLTLTYILIVRITFTGSYQLLDDNLLQYEPLYYDNGAVHDQHVLLEGDKQYLYIHFHAFGRDFNLQLARDTVPMSADFQLIHKKTSISDADLSFLYTGIDTGWPGSDVHGAVVNGTFQGIIHLSGETTYHVESSNRMFSGLTPFHSIIYSEKDYKWSYIFPEVDLVNELPTKMKYNFIENDVAMPTVSRMRRAAEDKPLSTNKTCTLKLVTDHMVWRYLMDKNAQNEDRTRSDITSMLTSHVRELNTIFGHTTFTLDKGSKTERPVTGIVFEIRAIEIMTTEDCLCEDENGTYPKGGICDIYLSPDDLLAEFADKEEGFGDEDCTDEDQEDTKPVVSATCLTFLFTARVLYRSTNNALLGLAYPPGRAGGICSRVGNNGLITLVQFTDKKFLPTIVTSLVFVHEVAHAFGAQHDNEPLCLAHRLTQAPPSGFYLMHGMSQQGHLQNNKRFSNCSLDLMSRILSVPSYTNCFQASTMPFCGNNIVEAGEECDCGMNSTCSDPCCHGRGYNSSTPELDCTLKAGAKCSPSEGPCCDSSTCQVIGRQKNFVCQNAQECVDQLICDGEKFGSACPKPQPSQIRQDGYICNDNGRMCESGNCNTSICKMIGWRECNLANDQTKLTIEEKKYLCYIGCQKTKESMCMSSHEEVATEIHPELSQLLRNITNIRKTLHFRFPIGTPCNKESGYCDVFYRCRGVEPETPLVWLKNCLLNPECILQSLQKHGWMFGSISFATCILFYLLTKKCVHHTMSYSPSDPSEVEMNERDPASSRPLYP